MSKKYCTISPVVKNRTTGEKADSILFQGLKKLLGYDKAKDIYYRTKNPEFGKAFDGILEYDEFDEPTLTSLLRVNLSSIVGEGFIEKEIAGKAGLTGLSTNDDSAGYYSILSAANKFNSANEYAGAYAAIVQKDDDGKLSIKIVLKNNGTSSVQSIVDRQNATARLNLKVRSVLSEHRLSVGALTALEDRLGVNGVYGGNVTVDSATGIATLIRIAKGSRGEEVLGEEFGHFIIESIQDRPFIQRLINLLRNRDLAEKVLGNDYSAYEEFDDEYISHEATARLLLSALYKQEGYEDGAWNRLLQGALKSFSGEFSKMSEDEIMDAVYDMIGQMDAVAAEVWSMDMSPRLSDRAFFDLDRKTKRLKHLAEKIYEKEIFRYNLISRQTTSLSAEEKRDMFKEWATYTGKLNLSNARGRYVDSIITTLDKASADIKGIRSNTRKLKTIFSLSDRASEINRLRTELDGIINVLNMCNEVINSEHLIGDMLDDSETSSLATQIQDTLQNTLAIANVAAINLDSIGKKDFVTALMRIKPEHYTYNKKGRGLTEIDLDEMMSLVTRSHDIGTLERWMTQASMMKDPVIQLASLYIKQAQEAHRLKTERLSDRIKTIHKKLRAAGIRNEDWMFEKDENGNATYNYISDIDYAAFDRDYQREKERLEKLYEGSPIKDMMIRSELRLWVGLTTEVDEDTLRRTPKRELYASDALTKLSSAQREYYDEFMKIRGEMLDALPQNILQGDVVWEGMRAVQIRKSLVDRLRGKSVKEWLSQTSEYMLDSVVRRNDDSEFNTVKVLQDLSGRKIYSLPLYFVGKVESAADLSHETSSSLLAFCDMAMQHHEMNKIVDILENGRHVVEKREAIKTEGGKTAVSRADALGENLIRTVTKNSGEANFVKAYDELLESQLYGRYKTDAGTVAIGNISVDRQKAASALNTFTALNQLGMNILAALRAVFNDTIQINTETITKRYFSAKELFKADREFFSSLPKRLGEVNKNEITSKVGLFQRMFNVLHDQDKRSLYNNMERSRLAKFVNVNSLFVMMNMGAEMSETRTAIAQAMHIKLRNKSTGEQVSLWDALEVVYHDGKGGYSATDMGYGGTLRISDGITTEDRYATDGADGADISDKDLAEYSQKFLGLNQRLFGVYNKEDRNAFQRTVVGSMVMMYRNYFVSQFTKRYGGKRYDTMLGEETEGYMRTLGTFLWNSIKEAKEGHLQARMMWNSLEDYQKENIARALTHVSQIVLLSFACALMSGGDWDKKKSPYTQRLLASVSKRTLVELNAMMPTGIAGDLFTIVRSPAASVSSIESSVKIIGDTFVGIPLDGARSIFGMDTKVIGQDAILESGKFKGKTVWERDMLKSPFCPIWNQIYRFANPEESNTYYSSK